MAEPPTNGLRAIVSDFGGVLTTPLFAAFAAFQDEVGISPENLGKAMRVGLAEGEDLPLFQLERGEISEDGSSSGSRTGWNRSSTTAPTSTTSARSSGAPCTRTRR